MIVIDIFISICVAATVVPGACLLAVNLTDSDPMLVAGLMAVAVTAMGAMFTGVLTNHIDIAPQFAGESSNQLSSPI